MIEYILHSNVINFILVVAFFVWLLFFKIDVVGLLEQKKNQIALAISDSEDKKEEAIKYFADTKESLANVDSDVEKIVQDAKEIAGTIEENSQKKLQEELNNLETRANILKEGYTSKAKDEVSKKVATAAVAISKAYIQNSLDENAHKELIYNFINDLDKMRVE